MTEGIDRIGREYPNHNLVFAFGVAHFTVDNPNVIDLLCEAGCSVFQSDTGQDECAFFSTAQFLLEMEMTEEACRCSDECFGSRGNVKPSMCTAPECSACPQATYRRACNETDPTLTTTAAPSPTNPPEGAPASMMIPEGVCMPYWTGNFDPPLFLSVECMGPNKSYVGVYHDSDCSGNATWSHEYENGVCNDYGLEHILVHRLSWHAPLCGLTDDSKDSATDSDTDLGDDVDVDVHVHVDQSTSGTIEGNVVLWTTVVAAISWHW
jgi:hypothetical protein